ncbi:vanadium-dependent haloperoxidase [Rhizobium sp. TH2]|uniref:vanadium-dependent haloperoxidase n=1 Tax=Rhizobium sp. TH2 TaxID=2775403 RepID=UPI0021577A19|nr:vanadium-dependent haloperoxidase [Rhizobium sp. TH2]UVC09506.1 vanadium-dependent haloperoxidase [Rhizobium sp. TH2]
MKGILRFVAVAALAVAVWAGTLASVQAKEPPEKVLRNWYRMVLELVRHTPTFSPPVASRAFAYFGVTGYEVTASSPDSTLQTLAGQLNGLTAVPAREAGQTYDEGVVLNAAIAVAAKSFFSHTGPTGQRALAAMTKKMAADVASDVPEDVATRSADYGRKVAEHILAWSATDGGAEIENMGFPREYALIAKPGHWVPTSPIQQQQVPLLPQWGKVRTFAMPDGATCGLPPPPDYSEDKNSEFYKQADEVYQTVANLNGEQRAIARFWSDDPMLSPTPPGHWISIVWQVAAQEKADVSRTSEALALLGVTVADAFIGCWDAKFEFDLIRPISYIQKQIDPKWQALLITPPFPEYPSGHSTQSAAAAEVLTHVFGDNYAFADATHEADGLKPRNFKSFRAAAEEAGISRLYGGIHFRAAIERGLEQGRCIGAYAVKLKTRK